MSSHNHQIRPSSAIYLGSSTAGTEEAPRPTASTPGTPHLVTSGRLAQLPSPPHTNSTSGSTGDKDSANAGSVRRSVAPLPAHEEEGVEHTRMQNTTEFIDDEDDDDLTRRQTQTLAPSTDARDRRVTPKLDRRSTLAERNREILDKLDRFGSLGKARTPSTGLSPLPRTASLGRSTGGLSNPAFTPSPMRHASLSLPRDREPDVFDSDVATGPNTYHEAEDRSKTPPASSPAKRLNSSPRQRLVSEPTSPDRLNLLRNAAGSQRRAAPMTRRELSTVEERSPANGSAKKRTPIPFEFLNGEGGNSSGYVDSEDGSSNALVPRPSTHSRQPSPGLYISEGSPSLGTSSATLASPSLSDARRPRPAGLRNSYDRWGESYERWEASQMQTGETDSPQGDGDASPQKRAGLRSVVNEGLRAAGLTKRLNEEPRARTLSDALALRASTLVNSPSIQSRREWESVDSFRDEPPRSAVIRDRSSSRMSDARGGYESQRGSSVRGSLISPGIRASRTIHNVLNSQDYDDPSGRETPANLRQFKSTYSGSATSASMGKAYTSPSGTQRYLPPRSATVTNLSSPFIGQTNSGGSSSGNLIQLLQDALFMFESHVQRLPQSSTMPDTYNDVLRDAKGIVNAASALNVALKSAAAICVDEQIEAEVVATSGPTKRDREEGDELTEAADVWRKVGAEFREDTRVSDELVRALTSFMIGTGRMLRSATSTGHSRMMSVDGSNGGGSISRAGTGSISRAASLHRGEHGAAGSSDGRRSVEGWSRGVGLSAAIDRRSNDGRLSVDGRRTTDGRRSVEPPPYLGPSQTTDEHREETMRRLTGRNPPRNPDDAASNGSGGGSAGSGGRLANRSNRVSFQAQGGDSSRPNTSHSMIRDVPRVSLEGSPVKTFTSLSSRRSAGMRTPAMGAQKDLPRLPLPDNRGELTFPQTEDGGDRTPIDFPRPHARHSTMPALAVPPPLPTLPSESLLQKGRSNGKHAPSNSVTSASTNSTTTLGRTASITGSHATVRGSAIIPSSSGITPTTAVTPMTARPREMSQSSATSPFSLSRARATTAISELQQVASADQTRKRTISTTDDEGLPREHLPDSPSLPVTSSTITSSTSNSKSSSGSASINGGTARRSALSNLGVSSPIAEPRRPPIKPLNRRTSSTLSGSGTISPGINSPTTASRNRIVSRTSSSSALTSPVSATGTSSAGRSFHDAGTDSADGRSGTEDDKKLRRSRVRMSLNAVMDRRGGIGELLGRSRLGRGRDDEDRVDLSDSPSHSAAERRRRAAEQLQ